MAAFALYYNGKYELVEFSKSLFYDLTNKFHFAVRVYCNRSRMTPGKN